MGDMSERRATCEDVWRYYTRDEFLHYLFRVLPRRSVVLCAASEPQWRHQQCRPRLLAESAEALSDQIASWLEAAFAGLGPDDTPPAYPSLHYAIGRHWEGGRDAIIEVDADEWQKAWKKMEPVVGVMEALGVPYTLRYSGHCSPHLCVAEEDFPETTSVCEALQFQEQLVSGMGRRLAAYDAVHLWPIARLPYSLNEDTGLACVEVASPLDGSFEPSQAHPEQVTVSPRWPPERRSPGAGPLLEWARGEREVKPVLVTLFSSSAPTPPRVCSPADSEPRWRRLRSALRDEMKSAHPPVASPPRAPAGMVFVPAGPFITGCPWTAYELGKPAMAIGETEAFFLDMTPVTNEQYQRFIEDGGYHRRELWSPEGWVFVQENRWQGPLEPCDTGPPDLPVRGVSCFEAEAYARWRGKRLPTFLEWEKACRGVDGRRWPWGDDFDTARCNTADRFASDEDWAPTAVGAFPTGASPCGCLDMVGNVWEWVQGEICIGGSFVSHVRESSCCEHHGVEAHARTAKLGFRCAQDVKS